MIVKIKSSHEEETVPLSVMDFDGIVFAIPGYFIWTNGEQKYNCCFRERHQQGNKTILIFYAYLI